MGDVMEKKKVSIIMPAYNCESSIKNAIYSVINQDYSNIELVVINDGSTDRTEEEIKKIKSKKIKFYTIKNHGVSHARNYGIKYSSGDYLMFIDSDDEYAPCFVKTMVESLENNKADQVCSSYFTIDNNNQIIGEFFYKDKTFINQCEYIEQLQKHYLFNQVWNKIYNLKIIKDNELLFDENISIAEDEKFNLDYLKYCNKMITVKKALYKYKVTPNGLGFRFNPDANIIKLSIVEKIENIFNAQKYNMQYVYESYITQYFSLISNIVDVRNCISKREKFGYIEKQIVKNQKCQRIAKESISMLSGKYKILANVLLTNNKYIIYVFGIIAWHYDKYKKKKFGGGIKC